MESTAAERAAIEGRVSSIWSDLAGMLDLLAETIVELLGFGVAAVNVVRPDGAYEVVSVAGDPSARQTLLGKVESPQAFEEILSMSEPWGRLRFVDHTRYPEDDHLSWVPDVEVPDVEGAWHPEDALFAPLESTSGRRLGMLSVDLPQDGMRPGPATCKALEAFAISTAMAIENAIHRMEAEEAQSHFRARATLDSLTGVGNRSLLFDRFEQVEASGGRTSTTALVFVDLDGFKAVNDGHSHLAGDRVLQEVAERIRTVVRPGDVIVRWGGDEFIVLVEEVEDRAVALRIADRLAEEVARVIPFRDHELRVTASVGIAFVEPGEDIGPDELVDRADAAMYEAKASGRNRCVVYGQRQPA